MIYDYYDLDAYNKYFDEFMDNIEKYTIPNRYYDVYLSFLESSEEMKKKFSRDFKIDTDAYLFHLIRRYALKNPIERKAFLKHPYIKSFKIDKEEAHISTLLGNAKFKFWIKGIPDIIYRTVINRKNAPVKATAQIFMDEYFGRNNGKCHETSIQFCGKNNVVTAFMHEPLSELRYLHSFVETDDRVLETTANISFDKEMYYQLSRPEIISVISGTELYDFYHEYMEKYPRLRNMSTKQLLVEFEEIKKNPKTIKLRPYKQK